MREVGSLKAHLVTGLLVGAMAALSHVPWGSPPGHGVLRLSWRTVGEKVRVSRSQGQDLPAHMRLPEGQAFDEKLRSYRLKVEVDGAPVLEKLVVPAGWRKDRPLSVFFDLRADVGKRKVRVDWTPDPSEGATWKATFEGTIQVEAGRIYTLDMVDDQLKLIQVKAR